jgi:hypothetical protein
VPPCLHTLPRRTLQPEALFAARFVKLYVLTATLSHTYTAAGVYDGYTLTGTAQYPGNPSLHVSLYYPVAKLLGRAGLPCVLLITGGDDGHIIRQVRAGGGLSECAY